MLNFKVLLAYSEAIVWFAGNYVEIKMVSQYSYIFRKSHAMDNNAISNMYNSLC